MLKKSVVLLMLVVALVASIAAPAQAQGGGTVQFTCTATLDAFPSPGAQGTCSGSAVVTVTIAGQTVTGEGSFEATFEYSEGCLPELNEPPLTGTAEGDATVTVGSDVLTTHFIWDRVGLTAAIQTSNGQVNGQGSAIGAGAAAFAPLLGTDNTCPEGGDLTAEVAGSAEFVEP